CWGQVETCAHRQCVLVKLFWWVSTSRRFEMRKLSSGNNQVAAPPCGFANWISQCVTESESDHGPDRIAPAEGKTSDRSLLTTKLEMMQSSDQSGGHEHGSYF